MKHTPLTLTEKKFYRPRRWTNLPDITDIMISCWAGDILYEATVDMPSFYDDGTISPCLKIFPDSFPILPLLVAVLITLPTDTTEDALCAALVAVGFTDATEEKGD